VAEVAFLAEIRMFVLMGTHDLDRDRGPILLTCGMKKEPFPGMRGEVHTYPNDVVSRNDGGIIFSMFGGADQRTCALPESRHVFYPILGVPQLPLGAIEEAANLFGAK
jgi:DNA/RNA-binding domain of Phe-tRNA-synthetase-like protein